MSGDGMRGREREGEGRGVDEGERVRGSAAGGAACPPGGRAGEDRADLAEAALHRAVSGLAIDPAAQAAAVAAFRGARDAGAHRAVRTRRRDDWRPRTAARRHSWRVALGALLAGLTLGGAAFAVTGGRPDPAPEPTPPTTPAAPDRQSDGGEGEGEDGAGNGRHASTAPGRTPDQARSDEALCRSAGRVGGKALDAPARQRLAEAAGGRGHVQAYCARLLAEADRGRGAAASDGQGHRGGIGPDDVPPHRSAQNEGAAQGPDPKGSGR
ncbi:hypothetical protein H9Y04_31980 [Streptomyces sp. TRM66268-LWL]|uniref:Uncharacterized protein n=1 Tax=Streptomyces polyasparticus TaxID=2767826 RepID=A0ABR7SS73_9ACTN|nr:hypothetical protein [Streptomyces polyasparticus]MBC9717158.1 hypothetical protein [Streptomyces polyasparticus]